MERLKNLLLHRVRIRVARCLYLKNGKLCFKKGKILAFAYFHRLKKGQLLDKFDKNSRSTNFLKKAKFVFSEAKPGNPGVRTAKFDGRPCDACSHLDFTFFPRPWPPDRWGRGRAPPPPCPPGRSRPQGRPFPRRRRRLPRPSRWPPEAESPCLPCSAAYPSLLCADFLSVD